MHYCKFNIIINCHPYNLQKIRFKYEPFVIKEYKMAKIKDAVFIIAQICIVVLALAAVLYRIIPTETSYALSGNLFGLGILLVLYVLFFLSFFKRSKLGFWYGIILSCVLLLGSLFGRPFEWLHILNVILLIFLIIVLIKERKKF